MPSLRDSAVMLDPGRYQPAPAATPAAQNSPGAQPLPENLTQSPLMISSLPSISSAVDGITRQFYGSHLPTRRLILP